MLLAPVMKRVKKVIMKRDTQLEGEARAIKLFFPFNGKELTTIIEATVTQIIV